MLGERFQSVDAIDVSRTVVDEAARRHPEIHAECCDVRELPYEDGTFDAVVSTSTLDHFETVAEIGEALRELRRVLAPGGTLVVSLDNLSNPLVAVRNALPFRWLHGIGSSRTTSARRAGQASSNGCSRGRASTCRRRRRSCTSRG